MRCSLAMEQKWVSIHRSMADLYGPGWAQTGPLVWGLYRLTTAKRHLNACKRSGWRQMKQVRTLCRCSSWPGNHIQVTNKGYVLFFPVHWRKWPLTSTPKTPYHSISVLTSGNGRKWVKIGVKWSPWSVCLKTLKRKKKKERKTKKKL
jgi:hypothetical protein